MNRLGLAASLGFLLLVGCGSPRTLKDYSKFRSENPASILVVPVVNRSVDVTAPDCFLSTLPVPLAERGYYVFPTYLVKRVLEDDGLSDANLVHRADPRRLGELFGADAILYVTIDKWVAKYVVFSTRVEVAFTYILRSGRTGEELWRTQEAWVYSPKSQGDGNSLGGLLALAVTAGLEKAAPDYLPLARKANAEAFLLKHQGLPAGPHLEQHGKDKEAF